VNIELAILGGVVGLAFLAVAIKQPKIAIFCAVVLIPFQQAFTLKVGGTIRLSDLMFMAVFLVLLVKILRKQWLPPMQIKWGAMYFTYLIVASIAMTAYLNKEIATGLLTLVDYNRFRWVIGFMTPAIALTIFVVGSYVGSGAEFTERIVKVWAKVMILLSTYVMVQFFVVNIFGVWPKLPGEVLNFASTYAYGLRRPWGFSIEPGALASLLGVSLNAILLLMKPSRLRQVSVSMLTIAIVLSFSSVGLFALVVYWGLVFTYNVKKLKPRTLVIISACIILSFVIILVNDHLFSATIGKLTGDNYSKLDRLTNTKILLRMFYEHPVLGIGSGNFGALRNLYSSGTPFPYREFYDMPNAFYPGILAEQGIIGAGLALMFLLSLGRSIRLLKASPVLFLTPILVLIAPSSTIAIGYIAFTFGLIISKAHTLETQQ
jgi:hypothetical protein